MTSRVVNGVETGDPVLTPPSLLNSIKRIAELTPPDPAVLPDGTIMMVVDGVWVQGGLITAPSTLAATGRTATSIAISWTNGDPTVPTEVLNAGVVIATIAAGTATADLTGLTANTVHALKVRHRSGGMVSPSSNQINEYTLPTTPAAPTLTSKTDQTVTLAFTGAGADQETAIFQDAVEVGVVGVGVAAYVATGLANDTAYAFTIVRRGITSDLDSPASAALNVTTDDAPDAAPSGLVVDQQATDGFRLTWTNGDAAAETEVLVAGSVVATKAAGITTHTVSGLVDPNAAYAVAVRHKVGSYLSASASGTAYTLPEAPPTPTSGAQTGTTVDLAWVSTDLTAKTVIFKDGVELAEVAAAVQTYQATGLTEDTSYAFTLKHRGVLSALDSAASAALNQATLDAPNAPPNTLAVASQDNDQIDVTWTNGDVTAETETYKDDVLVSTEAAAVASKTFSGLTANTQYALKIRHKIATEFSAYDGPITAFTAPTVPTSLACPAQGATTAYLTWSNGDATAKTRVFQDGVAIATLNPGVADYLVTGLTAATQYSFTLKHVGVASDLEGAATNALLVTTDIA